MEFEKNDKGCIRFTDTNGISFSMWHKFLNALNHLGYGMPDEDSVKTYFERGCFLQPDQSKEVLRVLNGGHRADQYSVSRINKDNARAKKIFGTTEDFRFAGYLLTDGDMLLFSYDPPYGQRDMDHREIAQALSKVEDDSYSGALIQFVNYGNIRLMGDGIELSKEPTAAQRRKLASYFRCYPNCYVDISNEEGQVVKSMTFNGQFASTILKTIDEYFEKIA